MSANPCMTFKAFMQLSPPSDVLEESYRYLAFQNDYAYQNNRVGFFLIVYLYQFQSYSGQNLGLKI